MDLAWVTFKTKNYNKKANFTKRYNNVFHI